MQTEMDCFLALEKYADVVPESPAILAPGRPTLSYSSLWRRVADIRRQLAGFGFLQNQPVPIVIPSGPDFLVMFLAASVFGPCAPLNPEASEGDYDFYFSRLHASALIGLKDLSSAASSAAGVRGMNVLRLSFGPQSELEVVEPSPGTRELRSPLVTDASLLLFTSSTTGRPKLVPLTAGNLEVSCRSEARVLRLTGEDRVLNLTPQFNLRGIRASLTQLCVGGSVICVPSFEPNIFPRWLEESNPTWISAPAAALGTLCAITRRIPSLWRGTRVRFIRSGGAAPDPQAILDLEALSGIPVLDGYGATETGCITRATIDRRRFGSVGTSTGPEIAILDEKGGVLPQGATGEIAVRGANITSGYLDDHEANGRAFRSGWFLTRDLGWLDEDGFLFLSGRIDELINRGGQKILPQEIESVLKNHPAVKDVAVFGVPHRTLGQGVAAAIVSDSPPVPEKELRQFAAERLKLHQIPQVIVFVQDLPRNAGGKLERRKLAEAYKRLMDREPDVGEPPATETEKAISVMWEERLRLGPVSRDTNFFRMGGDSLIAALVGAQIEATFGLSLDLRAFAQFPALRDFARVVDETKQGLREGLPALENTARKVSAPLSFAQERTWKYSSAAPGGGARVNYNVAFSHLLSGPLDVEVLRRAMIHLVARHEILRTTFEMSGGEPVQISHPPDQAIACDLPLVDLTGSSEPEREARIILDKEARKPFCLATGPLVRFVLARLSRDQHWLIRVNHHIISDAHSWKLYFLELGQVYDNLRRGRSLEAVSTPRAEYMGYALWQRREFSAMSQALRDDIAWWADRFSRLPSPSLSSFQESINHVIPGPLVEPVGAAQGAFGWGLDPEISSRLRRLQEEERVSFFEIRLGAFCALLARLTGQTEVIVGTHFSFRNRLEWQNIMGDFTNLVTLPLSVDTRITFREWVRSVHEQIQNISTRSEIPYELLRRELEARGMTPPAIDVMFHSPEQTAPAQFGEVQMTWLARAAPEMPWGFSMFMDKHNEDRLCMTLFDARSYAPSAVQGFVDSFVRFLDASSRHPDNLVSRLSGEHARTP